MSMPMPEEEMQAPPGLQQLLAQMQQGGGMPAEQAPAPEEGASTDDKFRQALDLLQQVLQEEPDDQDSAVLAQAVQALYKILSARQQEADKLMGGNPGQMRALRRSGV